MNYPKTLLNFVLFEFGQLRTTKEHIESFKGALVQNNVQHVNVVCRLFP